MGYKLWCIKKQDGRVTFRRVTLGQLVKHRAYNLIYAKSHATVTS